MVSDISVINYKEYTNPLKCTNIQNPKHFIKSRNKAKKLMFEAKTVKTVNL